MSGCIGSGYTDHEGAMWDDIGIVLEYYSTLNPKP